jgi:hypothetical protein
VLYVTLPLPSPADLPLVDAVRRVFAEEGRPPSRRRVEGWITAGAVTVAGRVVRDPSATVPATVRVSVDLEALVDASPGAPGAATPPSRRAGLPAGILHADAQVVVCDRGAFPAGLAHEAFAAAVAGALSAAQGRPVELHPVADPSDAGTGVVLLGVSRAAADRLAEILRTGAARETLLALRSPPLIGPGETVLQASDGPAAGVEFPGKHGDDRHPCALVQREDAPPGPPPTGARDGVPPHRAGLTFKHPRTNRRLTFSCDPSAAFGAACARLLGDLG